MLSYAINIACMRFGLESESSNGCVGFLEKTYPLSLDDLNEPCTAVIVKKELARQVSVCYSSKCSYLAQMIRHFLKFIFVRVFKKQGFWGLLSTWRPLFTFLRKKGFCALVLTQSCNLLYLLKLKITASSYMKRNTMKQY